METCRLDFPVVIRVSRQDVDLAAVKTTPTCVGSGKRDGGHDRDWKTVVLSRALKAINIAVITIFGIADARQCLEIIAWCKQQSTANAV